MLVDLADQDNMVLQEALVNGVPNVRYLHASRTLAGPEDVETWIKPMLEMLTKPLTAKEKESGFVAPSHLFLPSNIDSDGGPKNTYDPNNGYAEAYAKIWGVN